MDTKSIEQVHELLSPNGIELGDLKQMGEQLSNLGITQHDLIIITQEIYKHILFFIKEEGIGPSGLTYSNFLSYALDAKFKDAKDWNGSRNREQTTLRYKNLISV
jgi:hypothetical protein